jgi:urease accessory protein
MHQATTCITATDFLIPPELSEQKLAANGAGRIGGVRLSLEQTAAGTRLTECYQQIPLRVLPLGFGDTQPALIYLLNPTAGLFDGDAQLVEICAGSGSRAFVTGQSATRIHPCLNGFSTQQWRVRVDAGAILVVMPGPAIPFQGSRYYQKVSVDLAEGAHLIWGDIWLPGRYARGEDSERFQFTTLVQDFNVRRNGKLVFRDRFCWRGPWDQATAAWHFGPADCYGSLFTTLGEQKSDGERRGVSLPVTQGSFASFQTAENNSCLRWLGPVQWVTESLTRCALSLAGQTAGGGEPWLLASHDLGPNHWFLSQTE